MSYKLRISAQTQNDIECIYNYVLKDGISIAKKQADLIYFSLENLEFFPEKGANSKPTLPRRTIINFSQSKRRTLYFTESLAMRSE